MRFELTVGFPITSFQDWLLKPLGQTSVFGAMFNFLRKAVRIAAYQRALQLKKCYSPNGFSSWRFQNPVRISRPTSGTIQLTLPYGQNYIICAGKCQERKDRKTILFQSAWLFHLTNRPAYARILWQSHINSIRSDTQEAEGAPLLRE